MITIRDFLLNLLGGSELMWDVCLGVLIALAVAGVAKITLNLILINFGLFSDNSTYRNHVDDQNPFTSKKED